MAIITVSRELAALGDETARELAKVLNFRLVDKDTLEERIQSFGIEEKKFKKYDERKPSFFAALSQDRDDYLHYLQTSILSEAENGNCVIVGRGANIILKHLPAIISIFLSSPNEVRVERVKSYFHCDEKRAAQIIERSDRDRAGFYRSFFDIEWRHPGNYHLSFNTGIFSPTDCAEVVGVIKGKMFTPETEAQNITVLREMLLGHQIKHRILYEKELPIRFLEVSVSGDHITLHGATNSQGLLEAAVNAAREMVDSATVRNEIQIIREYGVMP
ncbi:MAG: cytidylate kinase family protein [Treponema sp.]|nr:cytidylate kinase family protein [Treponema sp.]